MKTSTKILAFPCAALLLMAGKCDGTDESVAPAQNTQPATTETASEASMAPDGAINIHVMWPTSAELVEVPIDENVYRENYMLVIDTSGSMGDPCGGENKIVTAQAAAIEFVDNIPPGAAIGLAEFGSGSDGGVEVVVSLGVDQHQRVRDAIANLSPGGRTPMAGGIAAGYNELLRSGSAQLGYGTYAMAILGDGSPGDPKQTIANIDYMVQQTRIDVTTIGFCTELNEVLERDGVSYYSATNLDELSQAFASVLAEAESFDDQGF